MASILNSYQKVLVKLMAFRMRKSTSPAESEDEEEEEDKDAHEDFLGVKPRMDEAIRGFRFSHTVFLHPQP